MTQGRYTHRRRRRRRNTNIGLWITALVLLAAIIALIVMMARSCDTDPTGSSQPDPNLNIQTSTGPSSDPTESTPTPTEGTTAPTEAGTAPSTEATEPSSEATEPSTEPTEPSSETTEPSTEPTEPTSEPTEPTEPPTIPTFATIGEQIAYFAKMQLGKPYLYGGSGPDAFDTSGFIYYCFRQNGIDAPRALKDQATFGIEVSKEDLQPGDAVFFWTDTPGKIQYPAIYIGDGKIIAARRTDYPVSEMSLSSSYYAERYITARRFG